MAPDPSTDDMKRQAAEGVAEAQYELGMHNLKSGDISTGLPHLESASNQRHYPAMFELAKHYEESSSRGAATLYKILCDVGIAEAQARYGICLLAGSCGPADPTKGITLLKQSAQQGNILALHKLGRCYSQGIANKVLAKDTNRALEHYFAAAQRGSGPACFDLAICYQEGEGLEKSDTKAFEWFMHGANLEHAESEYNISIYYTLGTGVERDSQLSLEYLERSADHGFALAQNRLGTFYYHGEMPLDENAPTSSTGIAAPAIQATEIDLPRAVKYFELASKQQDSDAMFNLAVCYQLGNGIEINLEKAFYWYRKAAGEKHRNALGNLGTMYLYGSYVDQDYEQALSYYEHAHKLGNYCATHNIGLFHEYGWGETVKDQDKAREYYDETKASNDPEAFTQIGHLYRLGSKLVPRNAKLAYKWITLAIDNGQTGLEDIRRECQQQLSELR